VLLAEFLDLRFYDERAVGLVRIAAVVVAVVSLCRKERGCLFDLRDDGIGPESLGGEFADDLFRRRALLLRVVEDR
jgi:hypothetical protein